MSEILPDPTADTVKYITGTVHLVLSVVDSSLNPISLDVGTDAPVDLYVEEFWLDKDLSQLNKLPNNRFGLFTNTLTVVGDGKHPKSIKLSGASGEKGRLDGYPGGTIEIYIEKVQPNMDKSLQLSANGGNGYTRRSSADPAEAGNGGNGGTVQCIIGSPFGVAKDFATRLYYDIKNQDDEKLSRDVQNRFEVVVKACQSVKDLCDKGGFQKTLEQLSKDFKTNAARKSNVVHALGIVIMGMYNVERKFRRDLQNQMEVKGGIKSSGDSNTHSGKEGTSLVTYMVSQDIWQQNVCFVHPVQCRMLLERAKLYYMAANRDKALYLLDRLDARLHFLTFRTPLQSPSTNLAKAYHEATYRLCLMPGDTTKEPPALTELRHIHKDGQHVRAQICTNSNFNNETPNEVPLGSYESYHKLATEAIEGVKETEKAFERYRKAAKTDVQRREMISLSSNACSRALIRSQDGIKEAIKEMKDDNDKIKAHNNAMVNQGQEVKTLLKNLESNIQRSFNMPTEDVLSAISQILFVPDNPIMWISQGWGLINKGLNNIEGDNGEKINKKWLIRYVQAIDENLDSLQKGYNLNKNGIIQTGDHIQMLVIEQKKLDQLLDNCVNALGTKTARIKRAFKEYIDTAIKRNSTILHYNACLLMISKCESEIKDLQNQQKALGTRELQSLDPGAPQLVVMMRKLYSNSLELALKWLYKMQQAHKFEALDHTDVVASTLKENSVVGWRPNVLLAIRNKLDEAHKTYKDQFGTPPTPLEDLEYYIPRDIWETKFNDRDASNPIKLSFKISPPDPSDDEDNHEDDHGDHEGHGDDHVNDNPWAGRADVRFNKVQFCAPGAITTHGKLRATLVQGGVETFFNKDHMKFEFTHPALQYASSFKVKSHSPHPPSTEDEYVSTVEDYGLRGPFDFWTIYIDRRENPGLDLSKVKKVYLLFGGSYRPMTKI
ncbi:hypothetical protein BDV30DRAFT_221721 [Aspergillus minisclerotigenes]|uniref:Uncharacterized protein n=1 Tax=Aspergillus minisclerotigenes TaxID=656917 RepID=A0A5N6IK39_9EURO|nr:hypothetical protein BDV30DRAFT_221721 [Aspergillus minisclerotigenes]